MNVVLLAVGATFLICGFIGYKKGLIKIAASLLTTIIIVVLVGLISPYVSQMIRNVTPIGNIVQGKMAEMILPEANEESKELLLGSELAREQQISLIENAEVPEMFRQMLLANNNSEVYTTLGVETFGEYIGAYITKVIADCIAFLVSLLVVSIVVRIAIKVLDIVNKLPVIGGLNRLAGGVAGLGIGIIVVWIGFIVVTLLYDTTFGKMCFENIETNPALTTLYDANILMKYIIKF